jgi:para-aminobenzoate synthetase component 1
MEVIERLELASREVYCGAVGWVDADSRRGELNVAIRTFWLSDGRLRFGTGAGITYDSTPAGEWAETELKARTLMALASAAGSGERASAAGSGERASAAGSGERASAAGSGERASA